MRWVVPVLLASCYSPSPQPGAPCSAAATCPSGLDCIGNVCVLPGESPADAPAVADADSPPDGTVVDGCTSFASQLDTCALPDVGPLVLSGLHSYNTDTHELRNLTTNALVPVTTRVVAGAAGPIDVILASRFQLTTTSVLLATGSRPFGIVASRIDLDGRLDVGSGGAGARTADACGDSAGRSITVSHLEGTGGAGGGAFRGHGGRGGEGDANMVPQPGGAGGVASELPAGPLGGCPGGDGGNGVGLGGPGGAGGGAVYLVARDVVRIAGGIHAGGGGGFGGRSLSGSGGGGGAGGMIWIEGASAMIGSTLAANGGGGGGGADDDGNDGMAGERALLGSGDAQGGAGGAVGGGTGGDGSQLTMLDGDAAPDGTSNAGGGGGGGAGFVVVRVGTASGSGTVSPPRSP